MRDHHIDLCQRVECEHRAGVHASGYGACDMHGCPCSLFFSAEDLDRMVGEHVDRLDEEGAACWED